MSPGPAVNLYQSHQQPHHSYTMSRPLLRQSNAEDLGGPDSLARSLSNAFYITSYQSEIARHAGSYVGGAAAYWINEWRLRIAREIIN